MSKLYSKPVVLRTPHLPHRDISPDYWALPPEFLTQLGLGWGPESLHIYQVPEGTMLLVHRPHFEKHCSNHMHLSVVTERS